MRYHFDLNAFDLFMACWFMCPIIVGAILSVFINRHYEKRESNRFGYLFDSK